MSVAEKGKILFVVSDLDVDWKPLIIGYEGDFIGEEILKVGHAEVGDLIPMPNHIDLITRAGIYIWEGEADWGHAGISDCGSWPAFDLSLGHGTTRLAKDEDLELAANFHIPGILEFPKNPLDVRPEEDYPRTLGGLP